MAGRQSVPTQEDISWVGSTLSGGHVIPAVIGIGLVTFLLMRRWLLAAFVFFVVAVESATYRATSLIVERERPEVERLESLPVDASYPSGHTAAAVAMYGGLLLLLASRFDNAVVRVITVVSRRGHPAVRRVVARRIAACIISATSSPGCSGLGALVILVFAARAARAATDRRDGVIAAGRGAS